MQIALHWRYSGLASMLYVSSFRSGLDGVAAARLVPALLVDTERRRFAHAQSRPGDLILFDQGVLQQLRSVVAHAEPPNSGMDTDTELGRTLRKLREIPSPSANWVVVALDVPPTVASDRIQARAQNSGRFDRMEADRRFSEYQSESSAQERILSILTLEGLANVVRLDGTEPVASLASQLAELIPAITRRE